jgi:hypothetical protein
VPYKYKEDLPNFLKSGVDMIGKLCDENLSDLEGF